MPVRSYIPAKLTDQQAWLANFQLYVRDNFLALGLTQADADAVDASITAYINAYTLAQTAETRTPATIAGFVAQQENTLVLVRQYAQIVNNNPAVTDEARAAAQITIRKTDKTPISAPVTWPVLTILAALPLQHKISYRDSSAPTLKVRAKPFGATHMALYRHVGATPPADPADAPFVALYTRVPFYVEQDPANVGQTAYYYGRWVTGTGLEGPLSPVAAMTIAA